MCTLAPELHAGWRPVGKIGEQPLTDIWNSETMQQMRRLHAAGRAGEIDVCSRCCTTIPHPALVAGSLILHGRTVRRLLPAIERLVVPFEAAGETVAAAAAEERVMSCEPATLRRGYLPTL